MLGHLVRRKVAHEMTRIHVVDDIPHTHTRLPFRSVAPLAAGLHNSATADPPESAAPPGHQSGDRATGASLDDESADRTLQVDRAGVSVGDADGVRLCQQDPRKASSSGAVSTALTRPRTRPRRREPHAPEVSSDRDHRVRSPPRPSTSVANSAVRPGGPGSSGSRRRKENRDRSAWQIPDELPPGVVGVPVGIGRPGTHSGLHRTRREPIRWIHPGAPNAVVRDRTALGDGARQSHRDGREEEAAALPDDAERLAVAHQPERHLIRDVVPIENRVRNDGEKPSRQRRSHLPQRPV